MSLTSVTSFRYTRHTGTIEPTVSVCAACGQPLNSPDDVEENRRDDHAGPVAAEQEGANGIVPHGILSDSLATFRALKKPLAWMVVIFVAGSILFQVITAVVEVVGRVMGWSR